MITNSARPSRESSQKNPSLADEPFVAAMKALPAMSAGVRELVRERLLKLAGADRSEAVDFSFGDSEIYWRSPGAGPDDLLAEGYRGEGISVTLRDQMGEPLVEWEGDVACSLLELGRLVGRERCDESAELTPLDEQYLAEMEV
jgi:hypothetical protein